MSITPTNGQLGTTESIDFHATVSNASNTDVTWTATGGTIDGSGHYTAPQTPGNYSVRATSVQDPSKWTVVQVKVNPIVIGILPPTMGLTPGAGFQFGATVTGPNNKAVTWSTNAGAVSGTGFYTAPAAPGDYTIRATSVADPSVFNEATVIVGSPISIYFQDFDDPNNVPPPGWANSFGWSESPSGRRFSGPFTGGGGSADTFVLMGLPSHRAIRLSYDLHIIGDWRNQTTRVTLDGVVRNTLGFSCTSNVSQNYPDGGLNPPGTGSFESNVLGYHEAGGIIPVADNTYHIEAAVPHTASTVTIVWSATYPPRQTTQTWGIDNVRVEYFP